MPESPKLNIGIFYFDLSTISMFIITGVILFIIARLAVRNLSVENPSKLQNVMEWVVEFVHGMVASTMPLHIGKRFISIALALILFIFIANLLGLPFAIITKHTEEVTLFGYTLVSQETIDKWLAKDGYDHAPVLWWKSPTADLSVTLGLALVTFFLIHYNGLKLNRTHYLRHYIEPYPIFLPLNIIKEIFKPLTLGLRLFANILAGEIMIKVIIMAGIFGIPFLMAWQGFSIFIGGLQAFVFVILSMVYIAQATVHEEQ
jgi:F-type H+-transporting ATPase subunit a